MSPSSPLQCASLEDLFFEVPEFESDLAMVVRGFFDDSGDDKRKRFVAVGGLIGARAHWQAFQLPWALATADCRGPFRSTDCEAGQGCCEGWKHERRHSLMRKLTKVIQSTHLMGLGTVVPVPIYRDIFPNSGKYDPYFLALKHTIINMAYIGRTLKDLWEFDSIKIFHEEGDTDTAALEIYKTLKAVASWDDARFLSGFSVDNKTVAALQGADLVAREAFKHADNMGIRRTRKPVRELKSRMSFHVWTEGCLQYLKSKGGPDNVEALTSWGQAGDAVPQMTRLYKDGFGY